MSTICKILLYYIFLFSRARNCPFDLTQPLSWTAPRLSVASGKQTLFSAFAQRTLQDPSPWSALPVVVCSSASVGRGKPGLSRAGPRAMGRGIPEGACDRGYAAKARCRQGAAADRPLGRSLPNDDDEPPGERGWAGKPSCRTVRRPKAGGKQSAQPGTGEGVRMEARRAKTWRALGQGLVHDSR